jgi:ABC-type dipeptide/oligopeptide/nickel transport system permease component
MTFLRTVVARILGSVVSLFGASIVSFVIMRVLPGDPALLIAGQYATPDVVRAQRIALGLDKPLLVQYGQYVSKFVHGDWGFSYSIGEPVRLEFAQSFPATVELALYAFLFAFSGAVVAALVCSYRRRESVNAVVSTSAFIGLGTPPFWIGLLSLMVLSVYLHVLPGPEGRLTPGIDAPSQITGLFTVDALLTGQLGIFANAFEHLVLPALVLGFTPYAYLVRLLRANLLEVSRENFLLVARSKGLSRWAAFVRHALPNAILPTVTAGGLILAHLIGGSVLIESVFDWPGVGQMVAASVFTKDFSVVQAFIIVSVTAFVLVNLVADLLYGVIDPRLRGTFVTGTSGL